jgi:phosphoglycolate phosphatase-like HAD superfamily hydrolase
MRAFNRAMEKIFGVCPRRDIVQPDGKTDPLIAKQLLAHFGRSDLWNDRSRDELFSSYIRCLDEEINNAAISGSIRILPGVVELLEQLKIQADFSLGLVTGNLERGARIKLRAAGLSGFFQFGGYGSDSEDRTELIRHGMRRGRQWVAPEPVDAAYVIGDTPLDIQHGRAAGASVIAVASARYSIEELGRHRPDFIVPDLTPVQAIISFMKACPSI